MLTKCLLAAILVLEVCWAIPHSLKPRITDSNDAELGEFPYLVSVQLGFPPLRSYSHVCGGAIVNASYVLTAAHCVPKYGKLRVVAGKYYLNRHEQSEVIVDVVNTVIHSQYHRDSGENDLALLKLEYPLKFNNFVSAVALPEPETELSGEAVLSGWGSTSKLPLPIYSNVVHKAVVPILENADCLQELTKDHLIGKVPQLFDSEVCTGVAGKEVSACIGDAGDPLVQIVDDSPVLVGIVSWNIMPCGSRHMPTIYARVSSFIDWINEHV
ncbi:trypsin-1-like [Hylaeus volcanicus]|uniref:trypsin-1-like n=1 Tax=Hylaeus volcanicus TaxID=313075 RepID=UPI0023B87FB2|nr:trypsin-1-like [Hylaeus volcanicus]